MAFGDLETFSGTSNQNLSAYNPLFVQHTSYSNPLVCSVAGRARSSTGSSAYYKNEAPPSADYGVAADFLVRSLITATGGVCARIDTSVNTMYMARLDRTLNEYSIVKIIGGTFTSLASVSHVFVDEEAMNIALEVEGDELRMFVDDVLILTTNDSSITAAGFAGLRISGTGADTGGIHIDNWQPYALAGGIELEADAAVVATATAALEVPLAASALVVATASGAMSTEVRLQASAVNLATAGATLGGGIALAADAVAVATASGQIQAQIRFDAQALTVALASALMSTGIRMGGQAFSEALATAALDGGAAELIAAALVQAGGTATITTQIPLSAAAQDLITAAAALTTQPAGLAADASVAASASAQMTTAIPILASAATLFTAVAGLTTGKPIQAVATVVSVGTASLSIEVKFSVDALVVATATGELSVDVVFGADAVTVAQATAVFDEQSGEFTALQYFRLLAPEFANVSDSVVNVWNSLAVKFVNPGTLDEDTVTMAVALYAAHMLSLSLGSGQYGSNAGAAVTRAREGDLERYYSAVSGSTTWLGQTSYGRQYLEITRQAFGSGIMTRIDVPGW